MTDDHENRVGRPRTLYQIVEHLDERMDKLENRVNILFAGLAVLGFIWNVLGPVVLDQIKR